MDLKAITDLALSLSVDQRARLAQQLLESLDELPGAEVGQLWREEAGPRADQIERREVTLSPADEVLAKARALLE